MQRCFWAIRFGQAVFAAGVLLWISGCVWKGGHQSDHLDRRGFAQEVWHSRPQHMRVYPSTRFVLDGSESVLEARIELTDEMGDPVKGTGRFRLELFTHSQAGHTGMGRRLYSWDVSVLTLADQRLHYDAITRAYLFRLRLDETQTAASHTVLQVTLMASEGWRLESQATLPMRWHTIGLPSSP